jgi:uncharacterized damage-inducible protein DinB
MTYYGGKELAANFRQVRGNTIRTAEDIPEGQYGFRPAPETRSVAALLSHIAISSRFQSHIHGNRFDDVMKVNFTELMQAFAAEEDIPRTKAQTIALLQSEGDTFATFLEGLSESFLAEQVRMPPGSQPEIKSRFEMLLSAKEHEMHHRGQLMIIQRMLGITPHLTRQRQERMAQPARAPR